MDVGTAVANTSVFPHLGSAHDVDTRVDHAGDESERVRIQPIDTKLNLHFKKTQVSGPYPRQCTSLVLKTGQ